MTSEKILEVENLLQALSEELMKLKSASEHYEETKENLRKMCESIDKISQTHQTLTNNIRQALVEMEKSNADNQQVREFIRGLYEEAKNVFESETQKHEAATEASLAKKYSEVSDEFRKETDKVHQDYANQSKSLRLVKALIVVGIVMEAIIIVRLFLF